ncbi:hypothetical protein BGZ60DRAFT_405421 [Tricladium varicosporioides]|nr:hypothetical protein BGZ60DRAFT_405421 [Hymenoscyphus varicosporioides]
MLDENLPTFFFKQNSDNPLSTTIFLSKSGSELQPEYTFRRPDPNLPAAKNCYGVALYDSYNPEVLYAEVLVQPEWTQPTLSAAEVRAQNGIPPPPVPIVPTSFTIQLYNPDQQVIVKQIPGSTFSSAYWEFEMPQNSFRLPSSSALDRSQNDPAISAITPKIGFKWKRDGKLSKDISCYLSGKTNDGKKQKEPDITVAMHKSSRDQNHLTIYEPNMHRVDVEDVKGLEVVLILGAAVIKDIFFNANREMFNISSPTMAGTRRKNSGPVIAGTGKASSPPLMSGAVFASSPPRVNQLNNIPQSQIPPQQVNKPPRRDSRPPPADPRTQWEIDAETARLLKEEKQREEAAKKERERAEKIEEKRIKKMLEEEEKERQRKKAEVDKETERLRKQYGVPAETQFHPPLPSRTNGSPSQQPGFPVQMPQHQSAPHSQPPPVQRPTSTPQTQGQPHPSLNTWLGGSTSGPYLQAPGNGTASSSGFFGLGSGGKKMQKKRSVFF